MAAERISARVKRWSDLAGGVEGQADGDRGAVAAVDQRAGEAAAADRQEGRGRHVGRHAKGKRLNAGTARSTSPPASTSTRRTATSMSPTATATGASWCSTRTASSCASGAGRRRRKKSRRASAARLRSRALRRDQQRRPRLRVRPPGRSRAGVRQDGQLQAEHLGANRHADAARPARHGVVDRVLARSRAEIPLRHERAQRAGAHPRSRERQDTVELRPARPPARQLHARPRLAVDSSGNLYVAETDTGRRMQKFTLQK